MGCFCIQGNLGDICWISTNSAQIPYSEKVKIMLRNFLNYFSKAKHQEFLSNLSYHIHSLSFF